MASRKVRQGAKGREARLNGLTQRRRAAEAQRRGKAGWRTTRGAERRWCDASRKDAKAQRKRQKSGRRRGRRGGKILVVHCRSAPCLPVALAAVTLPPASGLSGILSLFPLCALAALREAFQRRSTPNATPTLPFPLLCASAPLRETILHSFASLRLRVFARGPFQPTSAPRCGRCPGRDLTCARETRGSPARSS